MQKLKEAVLSSKGQITVPKAVRDKLGIGNGEAIAFYFDGDDIKVTGVSNLKISPKNPQKQGVVTKGEKQI